MEQAGSLKSLQQDVDNQRLRAEAAELEMKEAKSSLGMYSILFLLIVIAGSWPHGMIGTGLAAHGIPKQN